VTAIEEIVNQALRGIGFSRMIASIYEGSAAARAALEIYGQTRDEVLRSGEWPFALGSVPLTLLKGPPPPGGYTPLSPWTTLFPPPGYLYEYAYPVDCVELLAIVPPPSALPVLLPTPMPKRISNDLLPTVGGNPPVAAGPPQRVILTNQTGAVAVYRRRVTNPALWEPGFVTVLVDRLGEKLAASPQLANPDQQRMLSQDSAQAAAIAERHRG
jgi:hypothetical protein